MIEQAINRVVQSLRTMNVIQVARVSGLDPSTIYKIRKTGRIPLTHLAIVFEDSIRKIEANPDLGFESVTNVHRRKLADGRNAMAVALENGIHPATFTARLRRWGNIEDAATRPLTVR